jgi:two-component sensor histidine kinase
MLDRLIALRDWPLWVRIGVSWLWVAGAYAIQIPIEIVVPGEPFLLFFIVVITSTVAFGETVGFLACALSAVLSTHFFEPTGSLFLHHAVDLIKVELYAVICALSVLGLGRLRSATMQLSAALSKNERRSTVLLEEMTHRLSNNFAVVAALIRSKALTVAEPEAKSALEEAVEQVITMEHIHRNLRVVNGAVVCRSESFLAELTSSLKSAIATNRAVSITCQSVQCALPAPQAVPLGLIVNELVTNALKHAFPEGRSGSIRVSLDANSSQLILKVEDDGVGFPADHLNVGMGHSLLAHLTEQLDGRLEHESNRTGTSVRVIFPYRLAGQQDTALQNPATIH